MASPAKRFAPRDPREWTADTRRRRNGRAEIEAWMQEMDEQRADEMEELDAIYEELYTDILEMYAVRDRTWREN